MTGLIDYAGLFPPASLEMNEAVRRYAEYRKGAHAPALGRFIVPAGRLGELRESVLKMAGRESTAAWPLSVIAGDDLEGELAGMVDLEAVTADGGETQWARIAALELRASRPQQVEERLALAGKRLSSLDSIEVYFEIPLDPHPGVFVTAIADSSRSQVSGAGRNAGRSVFAKIRTGGVTTEAFPEPEAILRFLICARDAGVSFKATAGLHHPLRGRYPMTYEEDAEAETMTGFLNLFSTAAAIYAETGTEEEWLALLTEDSADAFTFTSTSIRWRDLDLPAADIVAARHDFARSYGSCSFEEPIAGLRALAMSRKEA